MYGVIKQWTVVQCTYLYICTGRRDQQLRIQRHTLLPTEKISQFLDFYAQHEMMWQYLKGRSQSGKALPTNYGDLWNLMRRKPLKQNRRMKAKVRLLWLSSRVVLCVVLILRNVLATVVVRRARCQTHDT